MEITIKGDSKEIADLAICLQSRQNNSLSTSDTLESAISEALYEAKCDIDVK